MKVTADRTGYDDHRLRTSSESVTQIDEVGSGKPIDPERQADFAKAVESSQARHHQGGSLRERIERLAQPSASDPSLYGNERGIELLQHVIENVLPGMDTEADVVELAAQVINEEIGLRLEWMTRHAEAEELDP